MQAAVDAHYIMKPEDFPRGSRMNPAKTMSEAVRIAADPMQIQSLDGDVVIDPETTIGEPFYPKALPILYLSNWKSRS